MNLRRLFSQLSLAAVAVIASVGIQAFAFTEPTTAPPQANAYAPINTGPSAQYKTGSLLLNTAGNSVGFATHNATELLGNTTVGTTSQPANLNVVGAVNTSNVITVNQGWNPAQALSINSNQIWKSATAGDPNLYLQWSNPGGSVIIGGQYGATNNLDVPHGTVRANDFCLNNGTKCLSSVGASSRSGLVVAGCVVYSSGSKFTTASCWGGASTSLNNVICPSGTTEHGGTQSGSDTVVCVQN